MFDKRANTVLTQNVRNRLPFEGAKYVLWAPVESEI